MIKESQKSEVMSIWKTRGGRQKTRTVEDSVAPEQAHLVL